MDKRFQQRLVSEAQARTQGREELVRDYIVCSFTILSKFEEPWDDERQLEHIYQNMLPELQHLVPREKVTDIDKLVELAREADALKEAERNYKPPPTPDYSLLPKVAYKGPKIAKRLVQRGKGSVAAMVACAPSQDSGGKESTNEAKPGLAAIAAQSTQGLDQLISQILDEKLSKIELSRTWPGGSPKRTGAYRKGGRGPPSQREKSATPETSAASYTPLTPASDKNANNQPGPKQHVRCWGCIWPGYIRPRCPECSGKGRGGE